MIGRVKDIGQDSKLILAVQHAIGRQWIVSLPIRRAVDVHDKALEPVSNFFKCWVKVCNRLKRTIDGVRIGAKIIVAPGACEVHRVAQHHDVKLGQRRIGQDAAPQKIRARHGDMTAVDTGHEDVLRQNAVAYVRSVGPGVGVDVAARNRHFRVAPQDDCGRRAVNNMHGARRKACIACPVRHFITQDVFSRFMNIPGPESILNVHHA